MRWIIRMLQCLTGGGGGNQVNFIVTKSYPTTEPPPPPSPTGPQSPIANMCCNSMHQLAQGK